MSPAALRCTHDWAWPFPNGLRSPICIAGAAALPNQWTRPLKGRIASSLRGFDGATFDGIVCGFALRNFVDRREVFAECARVLRRSGAKKIYVATVARVMKGEQVSVELARSAEA